jgi:uncharacterized membrane protein (UPF0127 family)
MKYPLLIMAMGMLLLGCSSPTLTPPESNPGQVSNPNSAGQMLPIEATALIGDEVIELEVARTPEQQAIGLMFRESLGDARGMLFPFPERRPASFWMKNTLIPLDMIFIRDGEVRAIASDVPPCKSDPCPSYGTDEQVDQVLELRAGRAEELGLEVGDQIVIEYLAQ